MQREKNNNFILDFTGVYDDEFAKEKTSLTWIDCTDITGCDMYVSEEAEKQAQPFDGVNKDLLVNMIKSIAETQHIEGKSKEQIISLLINMEPFARFPELVQSTLE